MNDENQKHKTLNFIITIVVLLILSFFVSKSSFIKIVSIKQPPYAQSNIIDEK